MSDTKQLREDLDWLAAHGQAEFADRCRVQLNWYREHGQLTPVLLATATRQVHEHRRQHAESGVITDAKQRARQAANAHLTKGVRKGGAGGARGGTRAALAQLHFNPTTRKIEVV